jgi:1-deoxy-D-xylulose-5-phosphate reductoisomerase
LKKNLAILGSTGSIGTQALDVVRRYPDHFAVEVLTAYNNCDLLIRQAVEFIPNAVVIGNEQCYPKVAGALQNHPVKVFTGMDAMAQIVDMTEIDLVLSALVGYAGLQPTLNALKAGKHVALANKETLVIAGKLVMEEAFRNKVMVLPVDSEHSAIFQCLAGEQKLSVEKIYLTASGGPFFGKTAKELSGVTKTDALQHPNWSMGAKVTIDSATMMNKGLEVIEAHWLFNLAPGQIDVVVHTQSIVHSLVQFRDGSLKAQLGLPDMRLPILYALSYPERLASELPRFSFTEYPNLSFHPPDTTLFRCLPLAFEALKQGGNMPCVLNAANEVAVNAFLHGRIAFLRIPEVIESCMKTVSYIGNPCFEELVSTHHETLQRAGEFIQHKISNHL